MIQESVVELESGSGSVDAVEDLAARWRQIIERQKSSGQTVSAFCRDGGIKPSSFFAWRRRLAGEVPGARKFVEVTASAASAGGKSSRRSGDDDGPADASSSIELCLGGGRRLRVRRGFDRELLLELLSVLESCP